MNALMLQGTASGVGKSVLVAGLCRLIARSGVRVAPFKPQNMSNNAAVCANGGEIGRAQALQAFACGLEPTVDMNPVLLKPEADRRAQLIVRGKVRGIMKAERFREDRRDLIEEVMEAFERLRTDFDWVMIEGAGSAAEPNLRVNDIANMGFATRADVPVWLVGDIDRGGVFASLYGTVLALDDKDRRQIEGFIINRFRGARVLLGDALSWLEERTGLPTFGVVSHLPDLRLPEEDSAYRMTGQFGPSSPTGAPRYRVAVIVYPRASNLSDFDPIERGEDVELVLVRDPAEFRGADLVILPGSKSVIADLDWLHSAGWAEALGQHMRYGGRVLGICGGMQMLGMAIDDPEGVEGGGQRAGLGWLDLKTHFGREKQTRRVRDRARWPQAVDFEGYEIHHGVTPTRGDVYPFHALSEDERVAGTYFHGLFDAAEFRRALFATWLDHEIAGVDEDEACRVELDRLADFLARELDLSSLEARIERKLS